MDYYKTVVGHMGIDPEYFWYRMDITEVAAICDVFIEKHKGEWEKTRIISYYAASGMSKLPAIAKFMPFPWDNESVKPKEKPSQERMNYLMKTINGN